MDVHFGDSELDIRHVGQHERRSATTVRSAGRRLSEQQGDSSDRGSGSLPNRLPGTLLTTAATPLPSVVQCSPNDASGDTQQDGTTAEQSYAGEVSQPTLKLKERQTVSDNFVGRKSLPTIKLGTYDGSTPLETHLAKLENCADYYRWAPRDRLCHLKASLVGQAGEVLWQVKFDATEADVVKLLRNRFGNVNQTERFRAELHTRRRRKGESIQNVYNDIRRLLALSFPGQTGELVEVIGRDAFLTALGDQALRAVCLVSNLRAWTKRWRSCVEWKLMDPQQRPLVMIC